MGSIKLRINVRDIAAVMSSYDVIRVKKSTTGESGQYDYITGAAATAAQLIAPTDETYNVVGKTLQILRDSHAQAEVTFTGTDPLTAATIVSQINTEVGVSIASIEGDSFKLTSTITGSSSKMEIAGGTAAADFGWAADDRNVGLETQVDLQAGVSLYEFIDNDGESGDYYKVNYYNTSNQLSSTDSSAFLGATATLVAAGSLSIASVDLVDGAGVAVANQDITFWSVYEIVEVDTFIAGIQRKPIATITTDAAGHAEVSLVRGLTIKAVFEGTSIIREFTVPDAASFNLLDQISDSPDPFDIRTPDFNLALRRTL